jgi:carbohydrate-binding DOMON domain-containing protein
MNNKARVSICALAVGFALAGAAQAEGIKFMDPTGDDKGPGGYTYPTDAVYTPGSFDLVEFEVTGGDNADFKVTVNDRLADPWGWASASRRRWSSSSSTRTARPAKATPSRCRV